jgi:hypothetical protein
MFHYYLGRLRPRDQERIAIEMITCYSWFPRGKSKPHHKRPSGCWWLTPVILATQEAEIRRIMVRSQPRQIVHETLS